jgi:Mannosyltransferase putative
VYSVEMATSMQRGLYFLANDSMLDMVIAFLNSVKHHNSDLPICFIPFNNTTTRCLTVAAEYGCIVWEDGGLLAKCDAISSAFYNGTFSGQYRKLALWNGPFEEFIYIDVDTIVLSSVSFVFDYLGDYDYIASHSHIKAIEHFVWKDRNVSSLSEEQISFSTNTGFFCSKKGVLSLEEVEEQLPRALEVKPYMELMCEEQPLLNWLVVTRIGHYTSLLQLTKHNRKLRIPLEVWGGHVRYSKDGEVDFASYRNGILLIHWAGIWREDAHKLSAIWRRYRDMPNK